MASSLSLLLAGVKAALVVLAGVALYSPEGFSPAPMPPEYSYGAPVSAPRHEPRALAASERVGEGRLPAPEDLAYDAAGGWLYTSCGDGWVRRVSVSSGDVEDWARTGGRPLGVALTADGGLVVADSDIVSTLDQTMFPLSLDCSITSSSNYCFLASCPDDTIIAKSKFNSIFYYLLLALNHV